MTNPIPAYGLWSLVLINSAIFIIFAFSFAKPNSKRDWNPTPQYVAFVLIMFSFLMQWPTLVTLTMLPALVSMYVLLALREEKDSECAFGATWQEYAARTPRFVPSIERLVSTVRGPV